MIAENLIKNKGFQDLIIFINGDSINIIVKAKELKEEQIAQIQNIISRELKGEIENIHISNKEQTFDISAITAIMNMNFLKKYWLKNQLTKNRCWAIIIVVMKQKTKEKV